MAGALTSPKNGSGGTYRLDAHDVDSNHIIPIASTLKSQGVRRLTPTECERLQALPDGWTDFGPDSRRYSALGDAVTSSVAEWIGRRLLAHITQEVAA